MFNNVHANADLLSAIRKVWNCKAEAEIVVSLSLEGGCNS